MLNNEEATIMNEVNREELEGKIAWIAQGKMPTDWSEHKKASSNEVYSAMASW